MLDALTNPYVISYLVLIALLYHAARGLRRMHAQNVEQRRKQLESAEPQPLAAREGQVDSMAGDQDGVVTGDALRLAASHDHKKHHAESTRPFLIQADWDDNRQVWMATSEQVRGLATEAKTIASLCSKLRTTVPELLKANGGMPAGHKVAIELVTRRVLIVPVASA